MKNKLKFSLVALMLINISAVNVFGANGNGSVPSRADTVNINDYSTDNWDRFEYNYEFESGADTKETFGVPTQTDKAAYNPELENIRRNKDVALFPPGYGVFSGDIPTEASSPYHSNVKPDYAGDITNYSSSVDSYYGNLSATAGSMSDTGLLPSTSTMQSAPVQDFTTVGEREISQSSVYNDYLLTEASVREDGSIGTLKIPALGLSVTVYEGEDLDNLSRGVGHFTFTSAWSGNIGIAGHNGGSAGYFEGIKDLDYGDKITFSTAYGTRTYEVTDFETISETDYSVLGYTPDNRLTLITCVEGEPSKRLAVIAEMVE
jgi:sortase A